MSVEAALYLAEALAQMREVSFHRAQLDWSAIRREAFEAAAGAVVPEDTYVALRGALAALGDHHSFLQLTRELAAREEARRRERGLPPEAGPSSSAPRRSPFGDRTEIEGVLHETPDGPIARIVIPFFMGADGDGFARRLQEHVAELDARHPRGWIVDLRGNGGGNMWPMLAGVGPLLGEGRVGSFLGAEGPDGHWFYRDGKAGIERDGSAASQVVATVARPYRLASAPPVAVLIDAGTASSGEALAIAFVGRPRTRSFGTATFGLSSSNAGFLLGDGANLVITVGLDVDRTGKAYPDVVTPDEILPGPSTRADEDLPLARALDWLLESSR